MNIYPTCMMKDCKANHFYNCSYTMLLFCFVQRLTVLFRSVDYKFIVLSCWVWSWDLL